MNNTKRKLLIVGSDEVWSIDILYYKHLKALGYEVDFFGSENIFSKFYNHSLFNKIIFKIGFKHIYNNILIQLKEKVNSYKPDIVWIFKGMSILPEFLEWARDQGIKLVNYNPDNPFIFTGKGSGNSNITNSIKLYDLHLTYNLHIQTEIEEKYRIATGYLPFGSDYEKIQHESENIEVIKTCFIGNPDEERVAFLRKILDSGIEIDIYGNNWQKVLNHKNAVLFPPIYNELFWSNLKRYRVQLNLMRIHNLDSHNMRTFEIPSVGGIMLAPDTTEHRIFFIDKKEVFLFNSIKDCIEKIQFLLKLDLEEANKIRNNALVKSVNSRYSYKNRASLAIDLIQAKLKCNV